MRLRILIFITSLAIVLCGCSSNPLKKQSNTVQLYYLTNEINYNTDHAVLAFETIQSENFTPEELIDRYLQGPTNTELVSPFPANVKLISINWDKDETQIILSKEITEMSGLDLTLASSCLARTLQSIYPAERYKISSEEGKLNGKSSIIVSSDTFLLEDVIQGK